MSLQTYSFLDVSVTIVGPGALYSLGSGVGAAKEGITVAMTEDKDTMLIGADGQGMHSLHGGNSGLVTVRLLKTSPTNALLNATYQFQRLVSGNWGQNIIVLTDLSRGDVLTASGCAFSKYSDLAYAEEAGMNVWPFKAIQIDQILGAGSNLAA